MSIGYAREKFSLAVRTLALGRGDIKQRLFDAWVYNIINVFPDRDLPKDIEAEYVKRDKQINRIEAIGDEGTLRATIRQMSEEEALEIATWIFDTNNRLEWTEEK